MRNLAIAAGVVVALLAGFFAYDALRKRPAEAPPPIVEIEAGDTTIDDPIAPGRRLRVVGKRAPGDGIRGAGNGDDWVTARPDERFRGSKSADARGVDPCDAPDPGFAGFSRYKSIGNGVLYLMPDSGGIDKDGQFDLIIHFHGHDMARKGFIAARVPIVFVALSDLDYRSRLSGDGALDHLLSAIETQLAKDREAGTVKVKRIALTSWSGGYEAVRVLLERSAPRIDSVVLLDGLHASHEREKQELSLAPFVEFAKRAARGDAFMMVTHSSIEPGTYASTTETANHLIHAMGGRPLAVEREDALGLELISAFSQGNFHVRGYAGGDKPDHCAHLALMEDATLAIGRRFKLRD